MVRMDTVATPHPANREAVASSLVGPLAIQQGTGSLGDRDLSGAQVLEIHVAARGHRVRTDRLAELLWGARFAQNAAEALQTFISVLRRRLTADRRRARTTSSSPSPRPIGSPSNWQTSTPSIARSNAQQGPRRMRGGACSRRYWHSWAARYSRTRSASTGSPSAPTEPRWAPCMRSPVPAKRSTQLPPYVAERTVAEEVREVPIP
jgi:hypothetical protein